MSLLTLNLREWKALEALAAHTTDAHILRRAQSLLWLDEGETVPEVAAHLRVTRQAVYKWVACFRRRSALDMAARLGPEKRSGRPCTVRGVIDPLIMEVIERDPRDLDYRSSVWTAPLLRQYLQEVHDLDASRPSVSLAVDRLGLRWKRPRHNLARRSATWRQAKGGSNIAWRHRSAPLS